jgi:hypothetical protein
MNFKDRVSFLSLFGRRKKWFEMRVANKEDQGHAFASSDFSFTYRHYSSSSDVDYSSSPHSYCDRKTKVSKGLVKKRKKRVSSRREEGGSSLATKTEVDSLYLSFWGGELKDLSFLFFFSLSASSFAFASLCLPL